MILTDKTTETTIKIENSEIKESECEKMLGITFEKKLDFKSISRTYVEKANQKIHALASLSNYIDTMKSKILMSSFITSQFNFCPPV